MNNIEAVARKVVEAVEQLYEVTGAFSLDSYKTLGHFRAQLHLEEFNKVFGDKDALLINRQDDSEYPFEKEIVIGGVTFFCLLTKEEAADDSQNTVSEEA